jgi:hypothetical protein
MKIIQLDASGDLITDNYNTTYENTLNNRIKPLINIMNLVI